MHMHYLDGFLGLFLVLGLFKGFRNGFFVELASLVSILLGIFIAIKCSYLTKAYLEHHVSWNPKSIQVAAFAITFIGVIILVSTLAKVFTSLANFAALGILNSILGAVFGVLKSILILSVLLNLFQKINPNNELLSEETRNQSKLYVPVQEVSKTIYPAISEWFEVFQSKDFKLENSDKKS